MDSSQDFLQGYEMDVDAFTTYLRDLADAIDADEVGVMHVDDGVSVPGEGMIEASLNVDYIVGRGHEDLLRPVEIEEDNDDE